MAFKRSSFFILFAAGFAVLSPAFAAEPQSSGPPAVAAPAQPNQPQAAQPQVDQALQDRVVALVQQRRCGDAVKEARKGGDENLALQVSDMCGIKPSSIGSAQASGGKAGAGAGGAAGK